MNQTITPDRLADALEGVDGVTTLSLDCFDTLLWRDVHAPADLFSLLTAVTLDQRVRAETIARKARALATRASNEVTLREIYRAALPGADDDTVERAVAEEIALEARHCYGFAPTIALMREAKRRGLQIVIVSDTYLEQDQLAGLIRAAAGGDVADMIDHIFCSSDYRRAKTQGLFEDVLRDTCARPDAILHVGDNPNADALAARHHGIQWRHLVQFTPATLQRLRYETAAGRIGKPEAVTFLPHRAAIAIGEPQIEDPAKALGFSVVGPILARFADWVADEADALAATRAGKVHIVFLMRDGYLPRAVFGERHPDRATSALEISRFTATAASIAVPDSVDHYINAHIKHDVGEHFLHQLLLSDGEARQILKGLPTAMRGHVLAETLRSKRWAPKIAKRGRAFADRLIAHVRDAVAPARGDTIMLVDLGYSGSIQDRITPLLIEAFGVHVAGRYLLLREDWMSGLDKRGILSPEQHGDGLLKTLLRSVAVLEQMCSAPYGSVIGYGADGTPLRATAGIQGAQREMRDRAQAGCLAFARAEPAATHRLTDAARAQTRDHAVMSVMTRFLTMPLPHEVELLAGFKHDGNLGGDYLAPLFDPAAAAAGLRERGLFYLRDAERMYLPAELSGQGMATTLTHLAFRRFDLGFIYGDFCDSKVELPLLVVDGIEAFHDTVVATPTHEGYYTAAVPIGTSRFSIGLAFGRLYEWVQIDSIRFVPTTAYFAHGALFDHLAVEAHPSCEGMEQVGPHLYRCDEAEAFLMVPPPPQGPFSREFILLVTFRPLTPRARALQTQPQAEVIAQ